MHHMGFQNCDALVRRHAASMAAVAASWQEAEEVDALATTYLTQYIEKPSEFYYCSAACHRSRSTSLA
jgi:hypothetical protein